MSSLYLYVKINIMSNKQIVILTEEQANRVFQTLINEEKSKQTKVPEKKVIKLKSSEIANIVKNILNEQKK